MTKDAIDNGYLKDGTCDLLEFEENYPLLKDRQTAKERINLMMQSAKENNVVCNDKNYVVIDGEKTIGKEKCKEPQKGLFKCCKNMIIIYYRSYYGHTIRIF